MLLCPQCKREWCSDCEQSEAIKRRGICISCLLENKKKVDIAKFVTDASKQCFAKHKHPQTVRKAVK